MNVSTVNENDLMIQNKTQFLSIISILFVAVLISQLNKEKVNTFFSSTGEVSKSIGTGGAGSAQQSASFAQQSTSFCRPNPDGGSGSGSVPTDTDCVNSFKANNNPCVLPKVLSNVMCSVIATPCATVGGQKGYICSCKYECANP